MEYEETRDELCQLDIGEIREDFETIWLKNVVEVTLQREKDPTAGDYFSEDDSSGEYRRKVRLNIQGVSSDNYRRAEQGLVTAGQVYKAYARWDEDIRNGDRVLWNKKIFIIKEHNKSLYDGQCTFQEFNLVRADTNNG